MTYTSSQYKNQARHGVFTGRDWTSLEKRLSETREMLKEILANLQLVLQNLRSVNRLSKDQAKPGPGFGAKTVFAHAAGADSGERGGRPGRAADAFARAKREYGHGPFAQAGQAGRFRTASPGFARAGAATFESGGFDANKNAKNPYGRSEAGQGPGAQPGGQAGARKTEADFQERARQKAKDAAAAGAQANANAKANAASGGRTQGATGEAAAGATSGRQHKASQAGSSRREYRRPFRPRGEMTLERARAILCLSSARNEGDIKSAYRKKARQYHPDLGGDEEMMKDLNLAYDLLLHYHFSHQAPTERNQ